MVAYSFAPQFGDQVASLTKRQTVRAHRRRHARPGELLQLYTAMPTKHCRKLLDRDPVCISVVPIAISTSSLIDQIIASILIGGRPLDREEIEAFAVADGFAPLADDRAAATARRKMGKFWLAHHEEGRFEGVLIRWVPT